ncbi:MAG: response regulator [Oscillospiraceae bacterium]|nr:response regulator [Oscillospiraceae bacterium]
MENTAPMTLLLIEDDVAERNRFADYANSRADVTFIGTTSSSDEGVQLVKKHNPEGVILDLLLFDGKGSGLQFLTDLTDEYLEPRPILVVTTHIPPNLVYDQALNAGVDYIHFKGQSDYSPEMVINTMLFLRKSKPTMRQSSETPEERDNRIFMMIDTELDLIGIRRRYKGHTYLRDAIFLLLTERKASSGAVLVQIAERNNLNYSSVFRAIETALKNAWSTSGIEDLQKHYNAHIVTDTGTPSSMDFIRFYADKIRRMLQ